MTTTSPPRQALLKALALLNVLPALYASKGAVARSFGVAFSPETEPLIRSAVSTQRSLVTTSLAIVRNDASVGELVNTWPAHPYFALSETELVAIAMSAVPASLFAGTCARVSRASEVAQLKAYLGAELFSLAIAAARSGGGAKSAISLTSLAARSPQEWATLWFLRHLRVTLTPAAYGRALVRFPLPILPPPELVDSMSERDALPPFEPSLLRPQSASGFAFEILDLWNRVKDARVSV